MRRSTSVLLLLACGACSSTQKVTEPAATISTPAGTILTQTGSAEVPASVNTSEETVSIPLPVGTGVAIVAATGEQAGRVEIELRAPTVATIRREATIATAPRAFAPPAPPSPAEIARGSGVKYFYALGAVLLLVAVVLGYLEHGKAAVFAGVGAIGAPILANFFSSEVATRFAIGAVCVSGALFAAWHLMKRRLPQ